MSNKLSTMHSATGFTRQLDESQSDPFFSDADVTYEATAIVYRWSDDDIELELSPVVAIAAARGWTVRVGHDRGFYVKFDTPN